MRAVTARVQILILIAAFAIRAQAPEAPGYEVASINPNPDNDPRVLFDFGPDGTLSAAGITLRRLVMTAYNVQGFRIVGGPGWMNSSRWDIHARPNRPASPRQVRPMLRALLEDRFHLRTHTEARTMPVYDLIVDSRGAKVAVTKDPKAREEIRVGPGSIDLANVASATFASQLTYSVARQIIDKTGLTGTFDFKLTWTPEPGEDGGATTSGLPPGIPEPVTPNKDRPSLFTAIREQLGLRLIPAHGPVDILVIDDVKAPTAN